MLRKNPGAYFLPYIIAKTTCDIKREKGAGWAVSCRAQNARRLIRADGDYNGSFFIYSTPNFSGHLVATFLLQLVNLVKFGDIG